MYVSMFVWMFNNTCLQMRALRFIYEYLVVSINEYKPRYVHLYIYVYVPTYVDIHECAI